MDDTAGDDPSSNDIAEVDSASAIAIGRSIVDIDITAASSDEQAEQDEDVPSENETDSDLENSNDTADVLRRGRSIVGNVLARMQMNIEDGEVSSESDSESDPANEVPFDIQLPYQHLYLARNFQALPGHTYLEAGSVHTLPLLSSSLLTGASVLIPGQTIPLNFSLTGDHPAVVAAMRDCLTRSQNMFGFMKRRWPSNHSRKDLSSLDLSQVIGVTLEIFEVGGDDPDQRDSDFCCKARVTQRFRLLEIYPQSSRKWMSVQVLILPEIVLERPLRHARGSNPAVPTLRTAHMTAWPRFVYQQYDVDSVVATAKRYCSQLLTDKNVSCAKVPDDPVLLSFWILINFPLGDSFRTEMLSLNNALQRLLRLIQYFKTHHWTIRCLTCDAVIGNMKDIFFMSASGPQVTYANPSGYLHETITLYNVNLDKLIVDPLMSTEYSWFPGYAWQVASCFYCRCHMGWQFVSVKKGLVPKMFYGITRRAITLPANSLAGDDDDLRREVT